MTCLSAIKDRLPSSETRTFIGVWFTWFQWNFLAALAPIALVIIFESKGNLVPHSLTRTLLTSYFSFLVTTMVTSLYQQKREHPFKDTAASLSMAFTAFFWTAYILINLVPVICNTAVHYRTATCIISFLLALWIAVYFQRESVLERCEERMAQVRIEEKHKVEREAAAMRKKLGKGTP